MSVEIRWDGERLVCDYGTIADTRVTSTAWGQALDVGPLVLVDIDNICNMSTMGVTATVDDALQFVRLDALNGSWIWRLEPAHRWDGEWPWGAVQSERLYVGRWPD